MATLLFVDLFIVIGFSYALYILRRKSNYELAGYTSTGVLFISIILMIVLQHGENYTLLWTLFFTPFSILTLGASLGLMVSFVFVLLLVILTYTGIDIWHNGTWNSASYLRFIVAHYLMIYVMFVVQHNNEKANQKIKKLRDKEHRQLELFEKLSITDDLTSLYNRRYFEEIFSKQILLAKREKKLLAFFLFVFDHF